MEDITSLTCNAKVNSTNISDTLDELHCSYVCKKGKYVIFIKPKKMINVNINGTNFTYRNKITYCSIHNIEDFINISIKRLFNLKIGETAISDVLEYIKVFEYGNPVQINNCKYQVLYSFDSNYFHGAFTAIYSLLYNFDSDKLSNLNINLCVPEEDFILVTKELGRFIVKSRIKTN